MATNRKHRQELKAIFEDVLFFEKNGPRSQRDREMFEQQQNFLAIKLEQIMLLHADFRSSTILGREKQSKTVDIVRIYLQENVHRVMEDESREMISLRAQDLTLLNLENPLSIEAIEWRAAEYHAIEREKMKKIK